MRRIIPLDLKSLRLPKKVDRVLGAYWKPNEAFVDELAQFLANKRVLEIFAGNGYLAGLLAARGIDTLATTIFSGHDSHYAGVYHPIEEMPAEKAVITYGGERDVLLVSWPTVTMSALWAIALWGSGRDIVFIGEFSDPKLGMGGLSGTATDEFFQVIDVTHEFTAYKGNMLEKAVVCQVNDERLKPVLEVALKD